MNWKRIGRAALCLLVVCCLIVNISPIKAKAVISEYAIYVALKVVLTSILIGLGIGFTQDVLLPSGEGFLNALTDFVTLNYPGVTDDTRVRVYNTSFSGNSDFPYAVDSALIELVRQWLFDNSVVSVVTNTFGFTANSIATCRYYNIQNAFYQLASSDGAAFGRCLFSLGVNCNVLILGMSSSSPYSLTGVYFDDIGRLCWGTFENSLGRAAASLLGCYALSDLNMLSSAVLDDWGTYSSTWKIMPLFFNESYARSWSDFSSGACFALKWDSSPFVRAFDGTYQGALVVYSKTGATVDWASSNEWIYVSSYGSAGYSGGYVPTSVTWSESSDLSVMDGLGAGYIAVPDDSLDVGYSEWSSSALTVPTDVSGLDEEITVYPIGMGNSVEETLTFSQEDVWNGENTYVYTPDAVPPSIWVDLSSDTVTYEQGAATSALVVNASSADGGIISYQWYQVGADGTDDMLIPGALFAKYIPPSDTVGTFQYYCRITNVVDNGTQASVNSRTATVEIVEAGSIADAGADAVTQSGLKGMLNNLASSLGVWFSDLIAAVASIPQAILDGIKAIFVPSEDFLTAKVEALRAEFAFADSIITTGEAIGGALTEFETSPPIIYMELANAESDYDWGERAIALDLRWYERYKPTVDQLLSALLWVWFAWRVFRKLPDIISGISGDVPEANVADGRFIHMGYASDNRRLGSGSLTRRK